MHGYADDENFIKVIMEDGEEFKINIAPHKKIKAIHINKNFNEEFNFKYSFEKRRDKNET